jgi:hypothetical protein
MRGRDPSGQSVRMPAAWPEVRAEGCPPTRISGLPGTEITTGSGYTRRGWPG